MAKAVTFLGYLLLVAGLGLIVIGLAGVAMKDGIWAAMQMLSPFNIANFIVTVATLAPGIALITWGQKMRERQQKF